MGWTKGGLDVVFNKGVHQYPGINHNTIIMFTHVLKLKVKRDTQGPNLYPVFPGIWCTIKSLFISFLSSHEVRILPQLWHHPPGLLFFKKAKPTFFLKKNKQTAPSTVLVSNASLTCVCLFSQEYFYMSLCIFHFECLYHSQTSMLSFFATTRRNCLHTHILRKISVLLSQILELLVESHYESLQSYEKTWRRNIWVSE